MSRHFLLDGREVPFVEGQSVLQAAQAEGVYIPHLCAHPEFKPHGSCRVCTVKANGHMAASCTLPAREDLVVESETTEMRELRKGLVQLLFVEGNHFCPSCEKSGDCKLQAVAYSLEVRSLHFPQMFPDRPVDASHPDVMLDFNRCILCELCVRASHEVDRKNVFAIAGHGIATHLVVNSDSGRLGDTDMAATDRAASICPVGVILPKRRGFVIPIGERRYDQDSVAEPGRQEAS